MVKIFLSINKGAESPAIPSTRDNRYSNVSFSSHDVR